MINILVVEDNEKIRENLCKIINENFYDINLLSAETGEEAIDILKKERIDLFFLDIELPDISGMKIAEVIRSIEDYEFSYIVFITTYTTYLPKALQEYHCYDFIEKPFSKDKIIDTINKLSKGIKQQTKDDEKKVITLESGIVIYKIVLDDIYFIEVQARNLRVHTVNGVLEFNNIPLKKVISKINEVESMDFIKVHKSYIVNAKKIIKVNKYGKKSWEINFRKYDECALLSEKYKKDLFERTEL